MSNNSNMAIAKTLKNDEFYTLFEDIETEINLYYEYDHDVFRGKTILCPCDDPEWSNFTKFFAVNFKRFGLKKLISTSYAKGAGNRQTTILEFDSPLYNKEKHETHGKLFTLTHDTDGSGVIDSDDIEFNGYLEGDGDFHSPEVCKLRDEADIIVTNPPFSLFREFMGWLVESGKGFIILGNMNSIPCKEIFPLIRSNKIWLGCNYVKSFICPDGSLKKFGNILWYTNLEHGKRHEVLMLDTMANNLRYNSKLCRKLEEFGSTDYLQFDNFNAIDVPFTECIPSDYEGMMGVPLSFLSKYNPNQFEIIGISNSPLGQELHIKDYGKQIQYSEKGKTSVTKLNDCGAILSTGVPLKYPYYEVDGKYYIGVYSRIFIRHRRPTA